MLLFLQEAGRRALWSVNGPRILQVGYEDEDDPKVMEAYELIGSLVLFLTYLLKINNFAFKVFLSYVLLFLLASHSGNNGKIASR